MISDNAIEQFAQSQMAMVREEERLARHVERALVDAAALCVLLPDCVRLDATRWLSRQSGRLDEIDRQLEGGARTIARAVIAQAVETFEANVLGALYASRGA